MSIGLPELLFLLVLPAAFGVWIWGVIDCVTKEPEGNDRIVWTIVVVFMHAIGAAVYLIVRRPQRIAQFGH